ncbi:MAG: autotransporter domain-containing protein [Methylobacteriaceae bacterium]|nr:autotransporter domain-containing protein [Methylobacteriaceae bacterium]
MLGTAASAAIVAGLATPAAAQTPNLTVQTVNTANLLSPFLSLNNTAIGQQTLRTNLDVTVSENQTSTTAQRQLAISDKALPGSTPFLGSITLANGTVVNLGPGDNIGGGLPLQAVQGAAQGGTLNPVQPVGGLGTQLGPVFQNGIRASTATIGPLARTFTLLNNGYNYTSNDVGLKNYFANGAATNPSTTPANYVPVPAVAPAGTTLPTAPYTIPAGSPAGAAGSTGTLPNRFDSVYDLAYGVRNTDPGQDVYGSSRPVQVAPQRLNIFDPTALGGLATNPSFPSGHTNYGFTDGILLAMAVPQLYQSLLARAAEYGDSRIVLGVHYPLDIIGSRALATYDLAQAFSNPAYINNAAVTGTAINLPALFNAGAAELQSYLSAQCGASLTACATGSANTTGNPYVPSAANQATYQQRLTYGLPILTFAQAPREAAPTGGPDASILLAPLYGGSTSAAQTIAPNGGLYGNLQTSTINQIIVNTETNALAAFYGTPLSYWSRIDLYSAAGYFGNVTGSLALDPADRLNLDVTIGQGGLLAANGTITGLVTVGQGGVLGGTGTVGAFTALAGGAVAPGNSIGTLRAAGSVTFAPGSAYIVEANAAGQSDRVVAGGTATIQGGTVQVLAAAGTYNPRTSYNILNATGGVTGRFTTVTSNFAFLNPYLAYDPNNVTLTLVRNDVPFAAAGSSANQAAAGGAAQSLGFGNRVYDAVAVLDTIGAGQAFNALSGEAHASNVTAQFETSFLVRETLLDRVRGSFAPTINGLASLGPNASLPAAFAADLPGRRAAPTPVPTGIIDPRVVTIWGQGFGSFGSTDRTFNTARLTRDVSGFVIGADATIDGIYRLGVAGGYTDTNFNVGGRLSRGDIISGFGAVYGGVQLGDFAFRVGGVFASDSLDTRRTVVFPGFSEALRGRQGGTTYQGFGELGYGIKLGTATLEPFVGGAGVVIGRDSFTEQGGVSALRFFGRDFTYETVTAGLRGEMALADGSPFSLRGLVAYRRTFGDLVPVSVLAFASGGTPFGVGGAPINRDAVVGEAGIDWKVTREVTVGVSYAGQAGDRGQDHGVRGNLLWRF